MLCLKKDLAEHLHNPIKQITFAAIFVKQQQRIWQLPKFTVYYTLLTSIAWKLTELCVHTHTGIHNYLQVAKYQ
jgi:hypothetical protein